MEPFYRQFVCDVAVRDLCWRLNSLSVRPSAPSPFAARSSLSLLMRLLRRRRRLRVRWRLSAATCARSKLAPKTTLPGSPSSSSFVYSSSFSLSLSTKIVGMASEAGSHPSGPPSKGLRRRHLRPPRMQCVVTAPRDGGVGASLADDKWQGVIRHQERGGEKIAISCLGREEKNNLALSASICTSTACRMHDYEPPESSSLYVV